MKMRNRILSCILAAGIIFGGTACSSNKTYTMEQLAADLPVVSGASSSGNVDELTLADGDLIAVISIKNYGDIIAKLFPDIAPLGVENFQKLADEGYYDGLTIHRVVSDFMMQGGSLNGDGTGGDALVNDGSFGIETADNARHFYGALCYANAMGTNTTQFYIVNNKTSQNLSDFDAVSYRDYADQLDEAAEAYKDYSDYAAYYAFQANYYRTVADWNESASDEIKNKYSAVGGTPSLDGNYTVFGQVYEGFDVIDRISEAEVEDNGNGEVSKPVKEITISSVKVYEYSSAE